ncbi:MAG: HAMP domain-containing sensor histidine kinase [Pseudomonadota bacterium]
MENLDKKITENLRKLMAQILDPKMDLDEFLSLVARAAKDLEPKELEARVYEVNFIENSLFLRTSTLVEARLLAPRDRTFVIRPKTITGDAIIENRVIAAHKDDKYAHSRFAEAEGIRAAFPIEFNDVENPEGRTKYVLVVDKKGGTELEEPILEALRDYSVLAGLAISIKELRDKLSHYYEANRNLVLTGRHSAAIGHDIRSLNTGVGGYVTLARRRLRDLPPSKNLEEATKFVALAQANAAQIEVLLKDFAQFNRASIVLNRDADLVEAVRAKVESLASRMDFGRLVVFDLNLPDEPVGFPVDPDWFGTVVENLVKNSVEACRRKARIKIGIEKSPGGVAVFFEDDCGGIPPQALPDLFQPFYSGKKTGQGLGLANAKKVVEDHGGTISVANKADKGAVFTVKFKLRS